MLLARTSSFWQTNLSLYALVIHTTFWNEPKATTQEKTFENFFRLPLTIWRRKINVYTIIERTEIFWFSNKTCPIIWTDLRRHMLENLTKPMSSSKGAFSYRFFRKSRKVLEAFRSFLQWCLRRKFLALLQHRIGKKTVPWRLLF